MTEQSHQVEEGLGPVPKGKLRTGWTTGTCAAAASKAAAILAVFGTIPESVEIALPSGDRVSFPIQIDETGRPFVIKDAGDDPDCTDGAHLTAVARRVPGLTETEILGGEGVGMVSLPGLGLEVGKAAINPVPRRMITAAVREVTPEAMEVTISVPGGELMATKTTNARLGIIGGISILGTTGIVKPFSTASFRASIVQQIDVASAQGLTEVCLATGSRSAGLASLVFPGITTLSTVEVGDFTGVAIKRASGRGFNVVHWIGMVGKVAKLATGTTMTHFHRSHLDTSILERAALESEAPSEVIRAATETSTARHFYEVCEATGSMQPMNLLVQWAAETCSKLVNRNVCVDVTMVDFDGTKVVARSACLSGGVHG